MPKKQTEFIEGGAVQLARMSFQNELWHDKDKWRVFVYIFSQATHNGHRIGKVDIPRGSYLRSYRKLIEDTYWIENHAHKEYSLSRIKQMTDELIVEGRLSKKETEIATLWSVCNYDKYQNLSNYEHPKSEKSSMGTMPNEDREEGLRTPFEHRLNNNKNGMNDKNVFFEKISSFFKEENISYDEKILRGRLRKVLADFRLEDVEASVNEAVRGWQKTERTGDFLSYWFTVLSRNYQEVA